MCNDLAAAAGRTKDFNQLFDSSEFYGRLAASNSPFVQNVQPCELSDDAMQQNLSLANDASSKKYAFNPLSEPFHPMQNILQSVQSIPSSPDSPSSAGSSNQSSIEQQIESPHSFEACDQSPQKFVCILCPEKFDSFDALNKHIANKVQQPYCCFVCGSTYAHAYLLQRHQKLHRTLKSVRCRGCAKKFRSINQLRKHFDFCKYKLHMFI